jgi:hypothetical protein
VNLKEVKHRKTRLMQRRIFMVSEYQVEMLNEIRKHTGVSMSELVREGLQVVIKEYANAIRKTSEGQE